MTLRPRGFQRKLLLTMGAGLLLLQLVTLVATHLAGRRSLQRSLSDELQVGARVFDSLLSERGARWAEAARVLAADFGFREVVTSGHLPTMTSVLENQAARVEADAALLADLEGLVQADTAGGAHIGRPLPVSADLVAGSLEGGEIHTVVTYEGRPHQCVLVAVRAPQPVAILAILVPVDAELLGEFRRLTSVEASIWSALPSGAGRIATTLGAEASEPLRAWATAPEASRPPTLEIEGAEYQPLARRIETGDGSPVIALLQRSIEDAWRPFQRLELQIFALSSLALLGALIAATFLARSISRPLHQLAEGARKIELGDYETALDVAATDEIGELAVALDKMRAGIGERQERIRHQATHDSLTQLPNRTLFVDRLGMAISQARRRRTLVGMIMMDLDGFKEINDALGHPFGDRLLCDVARRLQQVVRDGDTVARLGGDEFAVLFEAGDPGVAYEVADRLTAALEEAFVIDGVTVGSQASLGIAFFPAHAEDADLLMRCADVAMYEAKKNRLPFSVYEPQRDDNSLRRLELLSQLGEAIESDELVVHYHPNVHAATDRAVRAEALVRWQHPEHGLLLPGEFVPHAEQSGRIRDITRWVLRTAVGDCGRWRRGGVELAVSVNLSALDLYDANLVAYVSDLLEEAALPPRLLTLEVTESAVMKDARRAARILGELRQLGVSIAIDDFGTGYSSLAHLKRLPVDELKIDRSFVSELGRRRPKTR